MSFLKDFKDDLSQAVNELVDETGEANGGKPDDELTISDDQMVNTIDEDFSLDTNEIDAMLSEQTDEQPMDDLTDEQMIESLLAEEAKEADITSETMEVFEETVPEESEATDVVEVADAVEATETQAEEENAFGDLAEEGELPPSDEVTEITSGTVLNGDIESIGSINVNGKVTGNITCRGKLMVTGRVTGTSKAKEIFANSAKIEGDVHSSGTIKVAVGSVIVGNVYATSAVIGGAIKGDIDVNGPVIIDGTAVVKGNIKSRTVQINNGAVIDGFCSQSYADVDYNTFFEETFSLD